MTSTDSDFVYRFPDMDAATFVANMSDLKDFVPTDSQLNTGMMSDIGRATIYPADRQSNWFARFMRAPLARGDAAMTARFTEVNSRVYDPQAPDSDLFSGMYSGMISNVAKKNLSRQIAVEVNDYYIRQMVQTPEMIGDAMAAIMGMSQVCYLDDMWTASKAYFSGSTFDARDAQMHIMSNKPGDDGFGAEMTELLWDISQRQFGYKSTDYNASGYNTKSDRVEVALTKECEYPTFKKLLSETFNPSYLRLEMDGGIGYVDSFATPAGAPADAGELIGIVADPRAYSITPMPATLTTEAFRNPARKSTAYFTTYEYAFQCDPFFNIAYIFAPERSG